MCPVFYAKIMSQKRKDFYKPCKYPEHICDKLKTDSGTRFCGSTIPDPVVTTSRNMTVFFHSDGTSHYRGFQAEVSLTPGTVLFWNENVNWILWRLGFPRTPKSYNKPRSFSRFSTDNAECLWDYVDWQHCQQQHFPLLQGKNEEMGNQRYHSTLGCHCNLLEDILATQLNWGNSSN